MRTWTKRLLLFFVFCILSPVSPAAPTWRQMPDSYREIKFNAHARVTLASDRPEVVVDRWDGECFMKVKYPTNNRHAHVIQGNKARWSEPSYDIQAYAIDDVNFEYEVILKTRPAGNEIRLEIETKGLDFFHQGELSQDEIEAGAFRPEDVIGSYAVYHSTKKPMYSSRIEAEKYKAGKAFHIYRPRITDHQGHTIWGDLNISGKWLTIAIDPQWLDAAVYPVSVDPTFGYTTGGATEYALDRCVAMCGETFYHAASTGDTITSFHCYGTSSAGATGFDMAAYTVLFVDLRPTDRLAEGVTVVLPVAKDWASTGVSQEMTNGLKYCPVAGNDGAATENIYYDTGTGDNRKVDNTLDALPAVFTGSAFSTTRYSIYATYEAGPSAKGQVIMVEMQ